MRKRYRQRHQLRRLIDGISNHHALVAGTLLRIFGIGTANLQCGANSSINIGRLRMEIDIDIT